ncbi:MAG: hypothetical protein U9R16_03990 [Campylobacterota bacterium]|nr:hypothetical protein [Campylobacterota bacterium]
MKRSIVLVELIFSIALFSIIAIYSMNILVSLYGKNNISTLQTQNNIKLETTRLFLIKNNNFTDIRYIDSTLYFKNNILLDEISKYSLTISNKIATIDICIKNNTICQKWKIKTL